MLQKNRQKLFFLDFLKNPAYVKTRSFYHFSFYVFSIKSLKMKNVESHRTQSRGNKRALRIAILPNVRIKNLLNVLNFDIKTSIVNLYTCQITRQSTKNNISQKPNPQIFRFGKVFFLWFIFVDLDLPCLSILDDIIYFPPKI